MPSKAETTGMATCVIDDNQSILPNAKFDANPQKNPPGTRKTAKNSPEYMRDKNEARFRCTETTPQSNIYSTI